MAARSGTQIVCPRYAARLASVVPGWAACSGSLLTASGAHLASRCRAWLGSMQQAQTSRLVWRSVLLPLLLLVALWCRCGAVPGLTGRAGAGGRIPVYVGDLPRLAQGCIPKWAKGCTGILRCDPLLLLYHRRERAARRLEGTAATLTRTAPGTGTTRAAAAVRRRTRKQPIPARARACLCECLASASL